MAAPAFAQEQTVEDPKFRAGVSIGAAVLCQTNDDELIMEAAQGWLDEAGHTENTAAELWAMVEGGSADSEELEPLAEQMAQGLACLIVEQIEADYID